MNIEERILLNEIKRKNREVFDMMFRQYYPVLVTFAEGYIFDVPTSEDIVQSFFVNFWSNVESLRIDTSLKSYFFKCVQNLCLNHLRDLKIQDKHLVLYLESMFHISEEETVANDPKIIAQIHDAIEELPEQMQEIFRKRYLEGKLMKEISQELEVSDGTVKTQLFRARKQLRDALLKSTSCNFLLTFL
ncbi:RNA polymerase sigma-70 factor [Puteibacter caeruleilacunae]|nr:RNA polymerase sigma-70 factor [Puteibacter caeruleilacunae]